MDIQIADRLQKLRKEHGYSQEQLADELGVSRQAISKWERGEASPDTENLIALARLYGVTVDDVLFEKASLISAPAQTDGDAADAPSEETPSDGNDTEDVEICGNSEDGGELRPRRYHGNAEGLVASLTVMVSCIVYFFMGGIWGLWHPSWIVFLAIPVLPTIPAAIRRRSMHPFCFPVFVVAVYLLLGCSWGLWHPWWVVFFLIPVYYIIADFVDGK